MNRSKEFIKLLSKAKIKIAYKDESLLMKIIGYLLFFNKGFMTEYVTTLGNTVYFTTRKEENHGTLSTLAHEYVHAADSNKVGFPLFAFAYMFPQILAPLMLLLIPVNWILALVLFAVCSAPLPAYWRTKYELRGYKMSLFASNELAKERGMSLENRTKYLFEYVRDIEKNFTGPGYYFMWPFGVIRELDETVHNILSGDIFSEDSLYKEVADAFKLTS